MWRSRSSDARLTPRAPAHAPTAAICAACALLVGSASLARAQSLERVTADSVIAVDEFGGENVADRPQIVVDAAAAVRLGDHWRLFARPWLRQARPATPNGPVPDWDIELYEGGIRYERPGRVGVRVDAGYLASPIGLGLFEWRPSNNPTIVPHLGYAVPMPSFDPTLTVRASPIANSYPLAAELALSTHRWDARAAILNSSPTRTYIVGNSNPNPHQTPNVVVGGGVTPTIGLRLGASFARGDYATRDEVVGSTASDRTATILGGEGEYSFDYTSVRAELLRTSFDTAVGKTSATEWFVEGTQILSPRWFAAARIERAAAPPNVITNRQPLDLAMVETTGAFRVNPEITLRASYYVRRSYGAPAWDHQIGVSFVWAKRWW